MPTHTPHETRIIVGLNGTDVIFRKQCEQVLHWDPASHSDWDQWLFVVNESLMQISTIICDDMLVYAKQLANFPTFKMMGHIQALHSPVGMEGFTLAFREFAVNVFQELRKVSALYRDYDYLLEQYQEGMIVFMLYPKGEYLDKF